MFIFQATPVTHAMQPVTNFNAALKVEQWKEELSAISQKADS
jgi:hypothetical protein